MMKAILFGEGGLFRVRAILALGLTGVSSYMWATGLDVPDQLALLNASVVAFYFGTRGAARNSGGEG